MRLLAILMSILLLAPAEASAETRPVAVALDAEFSLKNSTSAQSIEKGIRAAIAEINAAGGVLGRPMELRTSDNRSVPMRGIENLKDFAADPEVVAVFGGRFSPVVIEVSPVAQEKGMILLAPWSSADGIIDESRKPGWVFRLSLRDEFAMPAMLRHAAAKGYKRVGLLLANTAWGRSNQASAERAVARMPGMRIVAKAWFNWGEASLMSQYHQLRNQGAEAILFVTNDVEGALLVRELSALPQRERLPLLFHWGITGGTFVEQCGGAIEGIDHAVVQTFSFFNADPGMASRVLAAAGVARPEEIDAPVGFAHAYDLTHILAKAIALAGTAERSAVRDALERVRDHKGLVRHYAQPFTPTRHEALGPDEVFMARYRPDGALVPIDR